MCVCVCVCVCIERERDLVNIKDILCYIFFFDPFKLKYGCYEIRLESANEFSVFNSFPNIFGLLLGDNHWVYIGKVQYSDLCILV